jgi:hypothetical protein
MFFSRKKAPLTGGPAGHTAPRLKIYSAQSGYVYHYYYEGHRPCRAPGGGATEFVFRISADRKAWRPVSIVLPVAAVRAWETGHERNLSATECYAFAKMALFQAFDERPAPTGLPPEVRVRAGDLEGFSETLGL